MINPCKKDCERRSVECHSKCEDYKKWKKERDAAREKERMFDRSYPISYGGWVRTGDGYWRNHKIRRRKR